MNEVKASSLSSNTCVVSYINNKHLKIRKITEKPLASQEIDWRSKAELANI